MLIVTLIAAAAPLAFAGDVIKFHDGDGPLWCRSGEKIRVAGIQAPDLDSAGSSLWTLIFAANADTLDDPDDIFSGQDSAPPRRGCPSGLIA